MRDVASTGLSLDQLDALSKAHAVGMTGTAGNVSLPWASPWMAPCSSISCAGRRIEGMPRHLSQHVGGFVISHHPLHTLVPVEKAAMRTAPSSVGQGRSDSVACSRRRAALACSAPCAGFELFRNTETSRS